MAIKQNDYPLEELVPVVAELASGYTGYEHSSITYEKAQMLMEGVLYCINEYEHFSKNTLSLTNLPAKEAYRSGQSIVFEKVRNLHDIYNGLIIDFQDYGFECLKDTIVNGIPAFLLRYDATFAPQETLLTLDYPILKDLSLLSGVSRILDYVKCVSLEQQFLREFDRAYVIDILSTYHADYEILIENICDIVLPNIIGHIMLEKPLNSTGFAKSELKNAEQILLEKSEEDMEQYIVQVLKLFLNQYYDNDMEIFHYLNHNIGNIVTKIQNNLQNHNLGKIFLI
ncbi:MAG: hypothetical protein HFI69_10860 [Lachnospiraceae bacterium]|nr:hypothetical protein [Lachnospiraceae bacterium]